jgi:hypothetical protein
MRFQSKRRQAHVTWAKREAGGSIVLRNPVRVVALAAALASAAGGAAAQSPQAAGSTGSKPACQEAGSDQGVVQGRLGLLEGLGPAAFIVTIPAGICLEGREPADQVAMATSVQLYSNTAEGFQDLYRLAGERVYARGRLTGQRSYQQKAPIMMEVIEIATK